MNIYAKDGTKVRFLNANGQEWERKKAAEVFDVNKEYTVANVDIGNYSSDVYFEEVAGPWNTVMFLEVDEPIPEYVRALQQKNHQPKSVTVVTHYPSPETFVAHEGYDSIEEYMETYCLDTIEELEQESCNSDFWGVTIHFDGEEIMRYGDHYHDKGQDKAKGFVDALLKIYPGLEIQYEQKADYTS